MSKYDYRKIARQGSERVFHEVAKLPGYEPIDEDTALALIQRYAEEMEPFLDPARKGELEKANVDLAEENQALRAARNEMELALSLIIGKRRITIEEAKEVAKKALEKQ